MKNEQTLLSLQEIIERVQNSSVKNEIDNEMPEMKEQADFTIFEVMPDKDSKNNPRLKKDDK